MRTHRLPAGAAPPARARLTLALPALLALAGLLAGLFGGLAAAPVAQAREAAAEAPYEVRELAPGVWAALQPPLYTFMESNSLLVAGDRSALVVDAQGDPERVDWLVARFAELSADHPVRHLVFSHWHGDHTQGTGAWKAAHPGLSLIGHRTLRRDVPGRTVPALAESVEQRRTAIAAAEERLAQGVGDDGEPLDDTGKAELAAAIERARERTRRLAALQLPTPDVAVVEKLEIDLGGVGPAAVDAAAGEPAEGDAEPVPAADVVILHLPGHTEGDLVVWLPAQRVLASGDLFDALPFGGHGSPRRWIASLEALAELPFETVVPGHGPVLEGDAARQHLRRIRDWIGYLLREAETAVGRQQTAEAALAALRETEGWATWRQELTAWPGDPDQVARFGRAFDAFAPETFQRAFEAASGGVVAGDEPAGD